jgi:hypothetical protein
MKLGELPETMSGTIVADETWIGGKPSDRHSSATKTAVRVDKVTGNMNTDKAPVLSLINWWAGGLTYRATR